MTPLDFNDADQQQFGELIPNGTLCKLIMAIRPGGAGPEGWLTESQTSDAEYINAEFTVLEGPYARRKLWQNLTFAGGKVNDKGQSIGGEITRSTLRAILESSRGINPTDMSEKAVAARRVQSFSEFDGITFCVKIGIEKGKDGYADKNKIATVITPDKKEYQVIMSCQYAAPAQGTPQQKPSWATGTAAPQSQASQTPATPQWAETGGGVGTNAAPPKNPKPTVPSWAT